MPGFRAGALLPTITASVAHRGATHALTSIEISLFWRQNVAAPHTSPVADSDLAECVWGVLSIPTLHTLAVTGADTDLYCSDGVDSFVRNTIARAQRGLAFPHTLTLNRETYFTCARPNPAWVLDAARMMRAISEHAPNSRSLTLGTFLLGDASLDAAPPDAYTALTVHLELLSNTQCQLESLDISQCSVGKDNDERMLEHVVKTKGGILRSVCDALAHPTHARLERVKVAGAPSWCVCVRVYVCVVPYSDPPRYVCKLDIY